MEKYGILKKTRYDFDKATKNVSEKIKGGII